jgi:hypothetical protein
MVASLGEAVLDLAADGSKLKSDVDSAKKDVTSSLDKIGGALTSAGQKMTGAVTLPILGMGGASIKAASDLEESMNAVDVVFGAASDTVLAFGETAAESAGLARSEFNQLAAQTGAMLTNMGFDQQNAANESINLAQRAADMASVFNTDVSQALEAIQAGLRGEIDPLERFGVKLSATAIEAKALEMNLADTKGEIDQNAKAQAALALIYEQTNTIAGDFVNTSDGLANSTRIAKAELTNAAAQIGTQLLPVALEVVTVIRDLVDRFTSLSPETQKTIIVIAGLAAAVGPLLMALGGLITTISSIITIAGVVGPALAGVGAILTGPVAIAIAAVIAAVGLLFVAWKTNFLGIKTTFQTVWQSIKLIWKAFQAALQGDWYAFGEYLRKAWDNIWNLIKQRFNRAKETLGNIAKNIVERIKGFFEIDWGSLGSNIVKGIANGITSAVGFIKDAAKSAASAALNAAKGFLGIGSPSKLFRDEVGFHMGTGVQEGWEQSLAGVQAGMQSSLNNLTGNMAGAAVNAPPGGAGSGEKRIEIHIHNPTAEPASETIPRELNRLSYLGVV